MTDWEVPEGLEAGGLQMWTTVNEAHELDVLQVAQLTEACRLKDRLDKSDRLLRGEVETWARLTHRTRTEDYIVLIDDVAKYANSTANQMKQLLAALRLPDEWGKRPQKRGAARGSYASSAAKSGKVSSLDRARAAKSGA